MNSKIFAAPKKFSTNLNSVRKRISKWLFIAGGLFLIFSQGYNFYISRDILYLGGLIVGIWISAQGLFFAYFNKNITLTVEDRFLRIHRLKTLFKDEKTLTIQWQDIQKILLTNYNIRLMLRDGRSLTSRLPSYNQSQLTDLKKLLKSYAGTHGFAFRAIQWRKNMKRLTVREPKEADLKLTKKNTDNK